MPTNRFTQGSVTANGVTGTTLTGDTLDLSGDQVHGIAKDLSKDDIGATLPTSAAVVAYVAPIAKRLREIDPDNGLSEERDIITPPIRNPVFLKNDEWDLNNWFIHDGLLNCIGGKTDNNIVIGSKVFSSPGNYFLRVHVSKIDSGYLLIEKNGTTLEKITSVGQIFVDVLINDPITDSVTITGINVAVSENISLSYLGIYRVADRFYGYFLKKIKELSNVDASGYVTKEQFEEDFQRYLEQVASIGTSFSKELKIHTEAENPHKITPVLIGAAEADHKHNIYMTRPDVDSSLTERLKSYSLTNHTHTQYVKVTDIEGEITKVIEADQTRMLTVSPMTIVDAPEGIVPDQIMQRSDITPPTQLLQSPITAFNPSTAYDYSIGMVSTNIEELMNVSPRFFSTRDMFDATLRPSQKPIVFEIQYHQKKTLSGYRFVIADLSSNLVPNRLSKWSVRGDHKFIHVIDSQPTYEKLPYKNSEGKDLYQARILFDAPISISTLSIKIDLVYNEGQPISLAMIPICVDIPDDNIGVTTAGYGLVFPINGKNRLIKEPAVFSRDTFRPEIRREDTPLYIYASYSDDTGVTYGSTPIKPEYHTEREGSTLLDDIYTTDMIKNDRYSHPVFGDLYLTKGDNFAKLNNIYRADDDGSYSWETTPGNFEAQINQTINIDDVFCTGYRLSWKINRADDIPVSWTLTIIGFDSSGEMTTVVADSVEDFLPTYNIYDDDIVYHKKFQEPIRISQATLTLRASDGVDKIVYLSRLSLYMSQHFYSIPSNTMYVGNRAVPRLFVGRAVYLGLENGFRVSNLCIGRTASVPINHFNICEADKLYTVPNPFFSTDVTLSLQSVAVTLSEKDETPKATIESVSDEIITIKALSDHRFAVTIHRNW